MADNLAITRQKTGKHFAYFLDGNPVDDQQSKKYFHSLGIPPAWQNVRISTNPRSNILATGVDKAGRLQYIYNPSFRKKQEKAKFDRTLRFARALPRMRMI